jgi:hypothetical protein
MNKMFAFVADLSGVSEKRETRLSEITLKKSGLAAPGIVTSNQIMQEWVDLQDI